MTLYCATTNRGKLAEFRRAAEGVVALEAVPGMGGIAAPEETGLTFRDNAVLKAVYYSRFAPGLTFADDSGLVVDALGGEPGVRSARYAGEHAGDAANNALLLERMRGVARRSAHFLCVIALARDGEVVETFDGRVDGELLEAPRGSGGFGYDPLFFLPAQGCTLAQATEEQKLAASHRGAAVRRMFAWLRQRAAPSAASRPEAY